MKSILEIGCGQGFNTYLLSKDKQNNVIGIDLSKEDIEISRQRYPNINFLIMNAEKLTFKNNSFDVVYAIEILEHIDHLDKVLSEVKRVLKKGGKFIVSIPYHNSEKWLLKLRPTYFKEIHHVRIFKKNELESLLKSKGFYMKRKIKKGFLQHVELYFLFKRKINSKTQVSIGSWRDNIWTKTLHVIVLYFDPLVLKTPLVYFPIWIITLPLGFLINYFGNRVFPKSFYYEFSKK